MVTQVSLSSGASGPDAPDNTTPPAAQRPEWLPEKFWDPEKGAANYEGLAASYSELEKKQSQPPPKEDPTPPPADPKDPAAAALPAEAMKRYADELTANGKLSDASYQELETRGISKSVVDEYIALKADKAQNSAKAVYDSVGGTDGYKEMVEWAATNLPESDVTAFDKVIDSGDYAQIQLAVKGLYAQFRRSVPKSPSLVSGKPQAHSDVKPFLSTAQLTAAMKDPRYQTDEAYRKEVENRLAISSI